MSSYWGCGQVFHYEIEIYDEIYDETYGVIYEVIMRKFRVSMEPFHDLKISKYVE